MKTIGKNAIKLLFLALCINLTMSACGSSYQQSPEPAADYATTATVHNGLVEQEDPPGAPLSGLSSFKPSSSSLRKDEALVAEETADEGAALGNSASPPSLTVPQDERKIILNATISLEALDFDKTCTDLEKAGEKVGGYISNTSVNGDQSSNRRSATFTFRIPAEKYNDFITLAGNSGNTIFRNEYSDDVTMEYIDIDARLDSLKTQEKMLLEMLEEASNLEELLLIQEELIYVQYERESFEATMRSLEDLISYSTVTVEVIEVKEITEIPPDTYGTRFKAAVSGSLKQAGLFFQNLSLFLVYALPYLIPGALLLFILIKRIHKSKKSKKEKKIQQIKNDLTFPYEIEIPVEHPKTEETADTESSLDKE